MPPVFLFPRAIVLDCGPNRTTLAVFGRRGRRLMLQEWAEDNLSPAPANGDQWREATRTALCRLRSRIRARGPVILVFPSHQVFSKELSVPRVDPGRLDQIVAFEAEQSIPYALADVSWQGVITGDAPHGREVLLVAAKLETVEPLCSLVQAGGFVPGLVVPAAWGAQAMFRALYPNGMDSDLLLVLGPGSATAIQTAGPRFAMRTFLLGASSGAVREAGELAAAPGSGGGAAIAGAGTWQDRLAREVTRSIRHFARREGWVPPVRVMVTGEDAPTPDIAKILAARLELPVVRLEWTSHLATEEVVAPEVRSRLFVPAGAAATHLLPPQVVVNLLSPRWRDLANIRQRRYWLLAALGLALLVPVPPLVQFHRLADEMRRKASALEREIAPWQARERRNQVALGLMEALDRQIDSLQEMDQRRGSWTALLADLQDRLTAIEDVWLEKLQVAAQGPGAPLKIAVAGSMLDRANPRARASAAALGRMKSLLASIGDSPFVAAVEAERLDNKEPGILRFEFVIIGDPRRPL